MTNEQLDAVEKYATRRDEATAQILVLVKELREAREVLGLILETDALRSWAFEADDDGESIYDMARRAAGKEPL